MCYAGLEPNYITGDLQPLELKPNPNCAPVETPEANFAYIPIA
jgi:hypothetical protein